MRPTLRHFKICGCSLISSWLSIQRTNIHSYRCFKFSWANGILLSFIYDLFANLSTLFPPGMLVGHVNTPLTPKFSPQQVRQKYGNLF